MEFKKDSQPHHAANIWYVLFKNKRIRNFWIPPPPTQSSLKRAENIFFHVCSQIFECFVHFFIDLICVPMAWVRFRAQDLRSAARGSNNFVKSRPTYSRLIRLATIQPDLATTHPDLKLLHRAYPCLTLLCNASPSHSHASPLPSHSSP
jgi:hypothetical protein